MWKKEETPTPAPAPQPERSPAPHQPLGAINPISSQSGRSAASERVAIGRSITIRGDVTGEEDLVIQGRVEGSINLKNHSVTIGSEGQVKASVTGRVVIVEGSVQGNIHSEEQVVLRATARVQGDITAPRLVLEDGARFRGGVDMGEFPEFEGGDQPKESRATAAGKGAGGSTANGQVKEKPSAGDARTDAAVDAGAKRKDSPELFAETRA